MHIKTALVPEVNSSVRTGTCQWGETRAKLVAVKPEVLISSCLRHNQADRNRGNALG